MEALSTIDSMKALKEQVDVGPGEATNNVVVTRETKIEGYKPPGFKGVHDIQ